MTVLDKSVVYKSGIMILPKRTIVEEEQLPNGYRYVAYTESRKNEIAMLMESLEMGKYTDSLYKLDGILSSNRKFFKEHCLCVVDDCDRLAGFGYMILDDTFKENQGAIGLLGVKEDCQRNGIAKAMVTKLSLDFDALKTTYPLYVKVDSYVYVAIAMFARMGFTPFMGAYGEKSEADSMADWETMTNILKEKTNQGQL